MPLVDAHWNTIAVASLKSLKAKTVLQGVDVALWPWTGAQIWMTRHSDEHYRGMAGMNYMGIRIYSRRLGSATGPIDVVDFGSEPFSWPTVILDQYIRRIVFGIVCDGTIQIDATYRLDFFDS